MRDKSSSITIFSLPKEIIMQHIFRYLDVYTKYNLLTTCKYFYNKNQCDEYKRELIFFIVKQLELRKRIHNVLLRNIFIESYNISGECEDCGRLGFLRQVDSSNYDQRIDMLPTKCICIESCRLGKK